MGFKSTSVFLTNRVSIQKLYRSDEMFYIGDSNKSIFQILQLTILQIHNVFVKSKYD